MRKLHPPGPHEHLLAQGKVMTPSGAAEEWTAHSAPAGRYVLRVEDSGGDLWHVMIDAEGYPERLQARLQLGSTVDTTWTFFDDEALVWCRGGGRGSDAVALPGRCRLLWPPYAGRGLLLGLGLGDEPEDVSLLVLERAPVGGLAGAAVPARLERAESGLTLRRDGAEARVTLAAGGHMVRWEDDSVVATDPTFRLVAAPSAIDGSEQPEEGAP